MRKTEKLLIGRKIKIKNPINKSLEGIEGIVMNETKNSLIIKTNKGIKKIIKKQITR